MAEPYRPGKTFDDDSDYRERQEQKKKRYRTIRLSDGDLVFIPIPEDQEILCPESCTTDSTVCGGSGTEECTEGDHRE